MRKVAIKVIEAGTVKRLHVDRRIMAQNRINGTNKPALTIQTSKGSIKAKDITVYGITHLIQSERPLSCGARAWVETRAEVHYQ